MNNARVNMNFKNIFGEYYCELKKKRRKKRMNHELDELDEL